MKRMHLVWALLSAGCGGGSFSADGREEDGGSVIDSGGAPTVRLSDDAGSAGASGGSGGEDAEGGVGGASGGTGGESVEDAGRDVAEGGTGASDQGGAGGVPSAGAGGIGGTGGGGVGGVGGAAGSNTGGTGGAGCELVTHETGLGQTWQDCVPLETYDSTQARKACEAWCDEAGCAAPCWTAAPCGGTTIVMVGQVGSGSDATTMAWSISSGTVQQAGTIGCLVVGSWR